MLMRPTARFRLLTSAVLSSVALAGDMSGFPGMALAAAQPAASGAASAATQGLAGSASAEAASGAAVPTRSYGGTSVTSPVSSSGVVPSAASSSSGHGTGPAAAASAQGDQAASSAGAASAGQAAVRPAHRQGYAARNGSTRQSARSAQARQAPPSSAQAEGVEHVEVTADPVALHAGGGMIRPQTVPQSVSVIGSDYIARQAPSATAYDLVSVLPGANVSSSDPLGFSPQTNISVRGLNGDAIGYALEGMPLNDIAYYTGYPSQFADSENYESVALAQGSADIESPVLNAAGGLMNLRFRTPAEKAGGMVNVSYGSYDTNREFIRLDSGEIGKTGLRGFVSYSHGAADNWRGPGRDERQHVDFKLLKTWGRQNSVALLGSWNQAIDSYYPQATKESWAEDGIHGANNLARHYDLQNDAQGTDYWRLYRQPERTLYLAAPVELHMAHGLTWRTTPYAQGAYGNAPGGTTIPTSGLWNGNQLLPDSFTLPSTQDGMATVRADYTQRSYRSGFTTALEWRHGPNTLIAGYWYDYSDDAEYQSFTPVSENGNARDIWGGSHGTSLTLADGSLFRAVNNHTVSQTNALFVSDSLSLLHDKLLLSAGFKEVMLTRNGTNAMPGAAYHANTNTAVPLPRLAVRYQITPHHQVFFNTTTNFRTPAETALYSAYDPQSGALSMQGATNVKNEYSISEELGYRYADDLLVGSLTLFNYNFTNRQIETLGVINGSYVSSTLNAGGQTSRGVDVELGLRPWHHFSPYVSGEYLHATIDNDLMSGGDLLPTRGKRAVRSPTLQAAAGLTYDDGHAFGVFTVKYTGHQYATFMNDERMPDYVTANMAVGYRFNDASFLHRPELRMNFINITNQRYLSGVADPTSNAKDTPGRYGTTIAGESPDYYIGGGFAALFTASTGF
ncbi:TonB-dependent receptor [Acetobacter senegalensis]|uniref:TonB-dependent receptor n=1 Tax=Acetobacter senegalensis TaxID=446692 RepID=UPI0026543087|nr:TonB-dependent receptor [Acetobacter senegalensis]MDN7350113.1 TonB-dependent receptor [Acetobacter senegalensis]